jgi:hypothetical protein
MFPTISLGNATAPSSFVANANVCGYAHGAMMFADLGLFFPLGGFIAQSVQVF